MDSHVYRIHAIAIHAIFHAYICSSVYLSVKVNHPCIKIMYFEKILVCFSSNCNQKPSIFHIQSIYVWTSRLSLNCVCAASNLLKIISAIHLQIIAEAKVVFEKGW